MLGAPRWKLLAGSNLLLLLGGIPRTPIPALEESITAQILFTCCHYSNNKFKQCLHQFSSTIYDILTDLFIITSPVLGTQGALCLSNERVNRLKVISKGRARHEYSVFTGASDKLRTWRSGSGLRENFLSAGGHSNPNRVSCRAGAGVTKKKKKPGDFACAVLLSRIPLQVKGSREVNKY